MSCRRRADRREEARDRGGRVRSSTIAPAPSPKRTASARCSLARSRLGRSARQARRVEDVPVVPRHEARVASAPTKRIVLALPRWMRAVDELEREDHRRALLADVERGDALDAELRAEHGAEPGNM